MHVQVVNVQVIGLQIELLEDLNEEWDGTRLTSYQRWIIYSHTVDSMKIMFMYNICGSPRYKLNIIPLHISIGSLV